MKSKLLWMALQATAMAGLCFSASAAPTVIAECGASTGTAYYHEGGIVGPGQGGWKHDGVSGGKVIFVVDGDKADIRFQDTSGRLRSHAAEGSEVRIMSGNLSEKDLTFIVLAENQKAGTVEHFLFRVNDFGLGTVAWGTIRSEGYAIKSSLMTASCGPGR